MIGVNLVPAAVLRARRRSRRIRQWTVAVAVTAGLAAIPVLLEVRQQSRLAGLLEREEASTVDLAALRAELQEITASVRQLRAGIERADTLRSRRPWAALLSVIVACMPEEVWLTSVATESSKDKAPSRSGFATGAGSNLPSVQEGAALAVVTMAGAQRLDLAGFALDHEQLYEFMTRLKGSQAFARVELLKAGKQPVLRSQGVRFELACIW